MSDLGLIREDLRLMMEMQQSRHEEVVTRLDRINGTIRRHDTELTELSLRQSVCQERCQECMAHLEPTVERLDEDIRTAKQMGKVAVAIISALFTLGIALVGLL